MNKFLIPGVDPEIEILGSLPPLFEVIPSIPSLEVHDLRGDPMQQGEDANARVVDFAPKISRFWTKFDHAVASASNVEFGADGLTTRGARILAVSNVVSHDTRLVLGQPPVDEPESDQSQTSRDVRNEGAPRQKGKASKAADLPVHYSGKTGFVLGRSTFNYYHFLVDTLPMLEVLLQQAEELGLDRIVVNPCDDEPGGFQREIVDTLWPEWTERIHFSKGPFQADHLTWCCIWPNLFQRDASGAVLMSQTPKGAAGRIMRRCQDGVFNRADEWRMANSEKPTSDLGTPEIVLISRKAASQRRIDNEDALFERLAPLGAVQVQMERISFSEKLRLMGGAKVVIGAHGAGLINAGFCLPGASCIEITSRTYLPRATWISKIAWLRNMKYHLAVVDEVGDNSKLSGNVGNHLLLSDAAIDRIVELATAGANR